MTQKWGRKRGKFAAGKWRSELQNIGVACRQAAAPLRRKKIGRSNSALLHSLSFFAKLFSAQSVPEVSARHRRSHRAAIS